MSPQVWLLADNLSSAAILGNRVVGIVIWIGVAILMVALLILMRTRWGQSQPLAKCVVLSVFAHLLLFLYAQGTRMIFNGPMLPGNDTIQLAFIATDTPPREGDTETQSLSDADAEPWERLPVGEPVEPREADAQRMDTDAQRMETEADEVTRATPVGLWTPGNQMPPQPDVPQTEPARPTVDPPTPITPPPTQSPIQPAAIDEVAPPPRMAPSVTIPEPVDPERIETASPTQLAADRDSRSPTAGRIDGCRIPHAAVGGCRRAIRNR